MPYSSTIFDESIKRILEVISPREVLDLGAGAGKYGKMVKENFNTRKCIAVEIDEDYIERFNLKTL